MRRDFTEAFAEALQQVMDESPINPDDSFVEVDQHAFDQTIDHSLVAREALTRTVVMEKDSSNQVVVYHTSSVRAILGAVERAVANGTHRSLPDMMEFLRNRFPRLGIDTLVPMEGLIGTPDHRVIVISYNDQGERSVALQGVEINLHVAV